MIWRDSLPARVSLITSALIGALLLIMSASAYGMTAFLLRQAVDTTLDSAATSLFGTPFDHRGAPGRSPQDRVEQHTDLPIGQNELERVRSSGPIHLSLVQKDGQWQPRTEPVWWQMLSPQEGELRVLYVAPRPDSSVRQLATSLEAAHHVLPLLFRWLALASAFGVALVATVVWRMTSEIYRPLEAVVGAAQQVGARSLDQRVPDRWHDRTLRRLTGVLNEMFDRLGAAFAMQSRFVAAAAHELRGPLGAMRAELEVTLRRPRTNAEYEAALEGALSETKRLSIMAEHLLLLARYDQGKGLNVESGIPLKNLLERAAHEVERATGGVVQVAAPADLHLDGDPLALERLFSNLGRNGVEAGGAPIRMEAERTDQGILVKVSDQGPGIPVEAFPHLFEPYYRVDPARQRDGGVGLGLSIAKAVVDLHGGTIQVENRPEGGARFTVWFPVHE
jgi:two-component system OmpR family sensor kinase